MMTTATRTIPSAPLRELTLEEMDQVAGGNSWEGGASLVIALGALGGPTTLAFAIPVAGAMFAVGTLEDMKRGGS